MQDVSKKLIRIAQMLLAEEEENKEDLQINQKIDQIKKNKSSLSSKKRQKCSKFDIKGQIGTMTVEELIDALVHISEQ